MPTALVPRIYDPSLADAMQEINTEAAYAMVKRMARTAGVLLGISGGAALAAAEKIAQEAPSGEPAVIVAVLPDSGDRYLSENFWNE